MDMRLSISRPYKGIYLCAFYSLMIIGMLFALASCRMQAASAAALPLLLRKGEDINGMTITTGSEGAIPLETFCNFETGEDVTETINCQVPALPKLAIGHMIGVTDWALKGHDELSRDWEVYLDGYLLDLDTFQEQTDLGPALLSAPSAILEGFKQRSVWDIVLIDPTFGMHSLHTTVQDHSIGYDRVVNFMISSNSDLLVLAKQQPVQARAGWEN